MTTDEERSICYTGAGSTYRLNRDQVVLGIVYGCANFIGLGV